MVKEAVILVGGKGTRLGELTQDCPKPLLPVASRPFLDYLIESLSSSGVEHIILSTGYLAHQFESYTLKLSEANVKCEISYEAYPLGTGGAIKHALKRLDSEDFWVLNGDSYLSLDWPHMSQFHFSKESDLTIAAREVQDPSRYGSIEFDFSAKITKFVEKGLASPSSWINGGAYLVSKKIFAGESGEFSFEKKIQSLWVHEFDLFGFKTSGYFVDIGIPEDLARAQRDFKNWPTLDAQH